MPYYEYPRHQTPTFYTFPSSPQSRQGERNRSERKTTEILLQDVGTLHDTAMVERRKTDMYGILIYSFVCPCRHAGIAVGSQIPPAPSRTEGGPALSQDLHVPSRGHPFVLLGSREHLAPDARRDFLFFAGCSTPSTTRSPMSSLWLSPPLRLPTSCRQISPCSFDNAPSRPRYLPFSGTSAIPSSLFSSPCPLGQTIFGPISRSFGGTFAMAFTNYLENKADQKERDRSQRVCGRCSGHVATKATWKRFSTQFRATCGQTTVDPTSSMSENC